VDREGLDGQRTKGAQRAGGFKKERNGNFVRRSELGSLGGPGLGGSNRIEGKKMEDSRPAMKTFRDKVVYWAFARKAIRGGGGGKSNRRIGRPFERGALPLMLGPENA